MGKLIHIGEHSLIIPEPKVKDDILFIDQKDPVWSRELALKDYKDIWYAFLPGKEGTKLYQDATLYSQDGDLVSLNKEDSDWMLWAYEREFYRRTHGVHVKIGDRIEWLTGDMWYILAWCRTKRPDKKGEYFDYREFQQWFLQLIWHIDITDIISGGAFTKAKKTGITNLMWLVYLNRATMTKNINLGHMNLDVPKGAKTFRDHFMYAFNGLPAALKPQIKSYSQNEGQIVFGYRFGNNTRSKNKKSYEDDELGTSVMCVPGVLNAFDVDVFYMQWYDEFPKHKSDFGEIYRSNEEGTALQDINVGKKILTSYTPESETPSFISGKQICNNSELGTIRQDSGGRTSSGLIYWHIPAYQSWTSEFNKYGRCMEAEAMKKILARRELKKGNPREYLGEVRRYANDKREAWTAGGVGSVFDNLRLAELLADAEEEERNSPIPPYVDGNLKWKQELWNINPNLRKKGQFSEVVFVPLTADEISKGVTGSIREYFPLPKPSQNAALKYGRDEWNNLNAPPEFQNVLGGDPTNFAAASEVIEGSKNSYHVMNRQNDTIDALYGKVSTKIITHEYFDRPERPEESYVELLKLIIYTGSLAAVEANAPYMATQLMEEGLGNYMLVKDESGIITIWKRHMGLAHEEDKKYHLLRTTATAQSKDTLEMFVRLMKGYFRVPLKGEKDYGKTIKSTRLLNQLMNIDVTNTKIFDLFMSWGWCLLADEVYSNILLNQQDDGMGSGEIAAVLRALSPTG
jgi:hypothetical protein